MIIIIVQFKVWDISINGAIFCHVIKVNVLIHENPSIIAGNQKWKGAIPIFSIRVDEITIFSKLDIIQKLFIIE